MTRLRPHLLAIVVAVPLGGPEVALHLPPHRARSRRSLGATSTARRPRGKTAATVTFPAGGLAPGDYVAHFLFADGFGPMTPGRPFSVEP